MEHHAILHSRECIQEGPRPHWTDRMFYDGKVYLSLEHNDTWTAHVPQAMTLKVLLDEQVERTRAERVRLQEGCIQLMKKLNLTEELPGKLLCLNRFVFVYRQVLICCFVLFSLIVSSFRLPQLLILIVVLTFLGLILLSIFISKNLGEYTSFSILF